MLALLAFLALKVTVCDRAIAERLNIALIAPLYSLNSALIQLYWLYWLYR
jgi:hypothetical protein